jgi:hypothetical protein
MQLKNFWVITPHFNSTQHRTRKENIIRFLEMCNMADVNVVVAEVAYGDREFELDQIIEDINHNSVAFHKHGHKRILHFKYRTDQEYFMKERVINIATQDLLRMHPHLVKENGEIAWIDGDCAPTCSPHQWFVKTKEALDHFKVVQMFEWLVELGPDNQQYNGPHRGFMASYVHHGRRIPRIKGQNAKGKPSEAGYGRVSMGGPGLAWCCKVRTLIALGFLIDVTILGAGDWWMAHSLLGLNDPESAEIKKLPQYGAIIMAWQERALHIVKKRVGYVKVTVYHFFHGLKEGTRFYGTRGQILIRNGYNPLTDLMVDHQGLYVLVRITDRQIQLADDIHTYMHARNEDSVPLRALPNLPEYNKKEYL